MPIPVPIAVAHAAGAQPDADRHGLPKPGTESVMTGSGILKRRRSPTPTGDAGFTLVELLAAMAIFSILMALVSSALLSGMTSVSHLAKRSEQQASDRITSEAISRLLRYAVGPEREIGRRLLLERQREVGGHGRAATAGDCATKRPPLWDVKGRAKW